MNPNRILPTAKAWAALVGAVVTALLGTVAPDTDLFEVLTAVAAVATAITVYGVPNKRKALRATGSDGWIKLPPFAGPVTIDRPKERFKRRWYDGHGNYHEED